MMRATPLVRRPALMLMSVVSLLALSAPTLAAVPVEQIPLDRPIVPNAVQATCRVGELGAGAIALGFGSYNDPSYIFYTLLDPQQCTACSQGLLALRTAQIGLRFTAACSIRLTVSVVDAGGTAACPSPLEARVLCPEVTVDIADVAGPAKLYPVPLSSNCCISRRAFLRVKVEGSTCPTPNPFFTGTNPCTPCHSYYVYPSVFAGGGVIYDTCDPVNGFAHNLVMSVDADCCDPTSSLPRTWGAVKTIYR